MKSQAKKTPYKKIALTLSLCALVIWSILGTGASLAWFTDVSSEINNIFHVAEFKLEVSFCLSDNQWEQVDGQTKIFDENALFEPGYVQIAYLKVENKSSVPFRFFTAVNVNGYIEATNVFGQTFMLQDYLKFGVSISDTKEAMYASISNREQAIAIANTPLHNYAPESTVVEPDGVKYIALVVRMPQEVGNFANYRGDTVPKVDLGITVKADQMNK